jgi:hypothetical protein
MTIGILEPIMAGLTVGIINKWILNNSDLWHWCAGSCSTSTVTHTVQHEDDISSSNTTVSDISLSDTHIHIH